VAVTDAYATAATYRAMLSKSDTAEDAEILTDLTAISRYIERKLGRFFTTDASNVTRVYQNTLYTNQPKTLFVDDLVSINTLKVDENDDGTFGESAWASTDYELLPRNAADGPEPAPYTELFIPPWSTKNLWGHHRVELNGKFGWPSVPSAIERACVQLTGILRLETPRGTRQVNIGAETVLETSEIAQDIVADLLNVYGKRSLF
jgi:hypothetical protein|tara:strand:- start:3384 stop:3998 length:615 start_codon:yes stop_codon:yes gene_type:complete